MKEIILKGRSGIYLIRHKSGRVYIGQAQDIYSRWTVHRCNLRAGNHHCTYLQRAWNKYGESEFTFQVVQFGNPADLDSLEEKWFNYYSGRLFNLRPPGKSARGFTHSEETKIKMREGAKRASNTPEQKRIRSERAKEQHRMGLIPPRPIVRPIRSCKSCEREFVRYKKLDGGYYSGETCLVCMAANYARRGGNFDLDKFVVSPDEFDDAAYEITWSRGYPGSGK